MRPTRRPNTATTLFVVVEKWESMDHLKAHGASAHMAAYAAKTREMLAERVIHFMENG